VGVDAASKRGDLAGLVGGDRLFGGPGAPCLAVADDPLVAGGLTGHQPLAQASHGADDDLVAVAADRVGAEGDPGRVGRHHDLDQDRHPGAGPGRIGCCLGVRLSIGGDARRGGRVQHPPHGAGHLVQTHIQDGLVLTGERRAGKVLGAS
jgi:hypothetical protein